MKKLFLVVFLLLAISTCDENPVNGDNVTPGRRDYIWTVDTLYSPNNVIKSIWGSSVNDVWAVGPGGITTYDGIWHFNGVNWQPYPQALLIAPECIYGFAQNDVWMGGNDGKLFHFNGSTWNQQFSITRQDTIGNWINDIWGENSNDIYAVGYAVVNQETFTRSFILHFNGTGWKEIYFSPKQFQLFKVQKDNNQLFFSGIIKTGTIQPDTLFFCKMVNNNLTEIYRNSMDKITYESLCQIGDKTYFLIGQDLYRYINKKFEKIISFNELMFGYQAYGRNEKDIFIRMRDGLAHFNGYDLVYLYNFSNMFTSILHRALLFDKDVLFTVHDNLNDYNLILRGNLIE